ncbi:MAG: right-handed parallel beta-helix repeat-containing protein [Saprospiraceae bacterium]|nr:right-handed parallel beta-helix repeat-containing protein [Saprospiraceae bacterium]
MRLILILYAFSLSFLQSKNYHIHPLGNDNNDGSSFNKAFLTIQKATNIVVAGDSILVYDGVYKGFDHFYKNSGTESNPIVYFAKGKNVVINQSCGRGGDGLNIEGNHFIEVNGFKVQFIPDISGGGEDGIRVVLSDHIIVRNCEVDSCYRGIFTGYTDYFLAEFNICKRSFGEHGIYVSNNSDHVILRHNICLNNRKAAGIQLNPDLSSGSPGLSYDISIYNNICYGNRIGLNLQGIYHSFIYNNLIYNNGLSGGGNGVTFFLGDAATGCNDVKFYNNTIVVPSSSQWGILAVESDSLQIFNNIILSFSAKGSLYVDNNCTNHFSNYNLLNDRMTRNDGASYINFTQWQQQGYDLNSILIKDIPGVFIDYNKFDFKLSSNSPARNKGTDLVHEIVTNDLKLTIRPQEAYFDIGCYEYEVPTQIITSGKKSKIDYRILGNSLLIINPNLKDTYTLLSLDGRVLQQGIAFNIENLETGIYLLSSKSKVTKILIHK